MPRQNKTNERFAHIQEQIKKVARNSENYSPSSEPAREKITAALDDYTAIKLYADWAGERVGKLVSELLSEGLTLLVAERQGVAKRQDTTVSGEFRKLLTAEEVGKILGVSKSKAYRMMQLGEIPTVRFDRTVRVRAQDLEELISHRV